MRCVECPNKYKCIQGDGPLRVGGILCIAEAPGKVEEKQGRILVGPTGFEYDEHYLRLAGLRREYVRSTNAIKCFPDRADGKLNPKNQRDLDLLYACTHEFLYSEIEQMRPRLIVAMGAFANKAIDPDIDLELQHGVPIETARGVVFPMYHPAMGMHSPKTLLIIRSDWIRLGKFLEGKLELPKDEYPNPDYRVADKAQVRADLSACLDDPLACDTENMRKNRTPFCLTYSVERGTGRFISAQDDEALAEFQAHIDHWRGPILWHNWGWDVDITGDMGLAFPESRVVDTLVRVFNLGNLPQGLKALAYRELGMEMKDFDDVVTPVAKEMVLDYYNRAKEIKWPKPPEQQIRQDDGTFKTYKPQGFNTKLKRFFTDYAKSPDTKDVFEMWEKNWTEQHLMIEEQLGEWPGKCISYAPFDDVLFYSCRDADALLRLWDKIRLARTRVRKGPQETWINQSTNYNRDSSRSLSY